MKILFKLLVVIILVGVGYFVYQSATESRETTEIKLMPTLAWAFEELPENPEIFTPQTAVTLSVNDSKVYTDVFTGSCSTIDGSSWTLQSGEVSGVICWWAGGGKEIGIFSERDDLVLKVGDLDEGSAETPGFRGNFKTILELQQ
ncbi:MAG TPA: hypothetical protein VJH33_01625 [Candidatus Paceibacterota bacterium]